MLQRYRERQSIQTRSYLALVAIRQNGRRALCRKVERLTTDEIADRHLFDRLYPSPQQKSYKP
jgi:hypothetical protein